MKVLPSMIQLHKGSCTNTESDAYRLVEPLRQLAKFLLDL